MKQTQQSESCLLFRLDLLFYLYIRTVIRKLALFPKSRSFEDVGIIDKIQKIVSVRYVIIKIWLEFMRVVSI